MIARGLKPLAGLPSSRLDLFSFAGHDPRSVPLLMDQGLFPWWADPDVKLAFFRPLASLTHLADWTLWPRAPALMHAHNLAWFALALVAAAAFYRRFLDGWVAALALFLYAVDDAHGPAVGWIANRNAMITVALGLPVVLLHDRGRKGERRLGLYAPLLFFVALLAGEGALAVAGYLFAYALCLDEAPLAERARSLSPYLAAVVVWRVLYHALGYGTAHSGIYFDPGSQPIAFLRALPGRAAYLLAGQLFVQWSDFGSGWPYVSERAAAIALAVAAVTVAAFAALFWPLVRRDRHARFFAVGALLAVLPIAGSFPADRLLWFVGIGAMGVVARFIAEARTRATRVVAGVLVVVHVVFALPLLALRSRSMDTVQKPLALANESLPSSRLLGHRTVILVNPPGDFFSCFLMTMRAFEGAPLARLRWLATGERAVTLTRVDARTLRVAPEGGFLAFSGERMLRSLERPFTRGERIALTGVTFVVETVLPDGRPAEVEAEFDRPLEDPAWYWAAWRGRGYVTFTPPPVGARVVLPGVSFLEALFPK